AVDSSKLSKKIKIFDFKVDSTSTAEQIFQKTIQKHNGNELHEKSTNYIIRKISRPEFHSQTFMNLAG
uniref:Uncharacterized protein n=1 Tax=Romanomermis culicivorax TaxID=13658 RepID=A0A915KFP5_ROMCU